MSNPRLASRYAKSILEIGIEQNRLEEIYQDMQKLEKLCGQSKDFVNFLKSPIIKPDRKKKVLEKIMQEHVEDITARFADLMVKKGREELLPEVIESFIAQYKAHKEIHIAKLTTAVPISEELKSKLLARLKQGSRLEHIEMLAEVNKDIIGGFVLEMDGKLINASLRYELQNVRMQFNKNDFIFRVR
jgi:F-type H+-transporting ATPase subunit delta